MQNSANITRDDNDVSEFYNQVNSQVEPGKPKMFSSSSQSEFFCRKSVKLLLLKFYLGPEPFHEGIGNGTLNDSEATNATEGWGNMLSGG